MPNSSPTLIAKLMRPSEMMQVTKGTLEDELSLSTSSLNGARKFFLVASHMDGTSWVASRSDGGNPSGIVLNWKSYIDFLLGRPAELLMLLSFVSGKLRGALMFAPKDLQLSPFCADLS
ncbi:hypothetical protein FCV25MIE_06621 [Fagus crenata]